MYYWLGKLLILLIFCFSIVKSVLSDDSNIKYTVLVKPNLQVGVKKNINFTLSTDLEQIVTDKMDENIIFKNVKLKSTFEFDCVIEVLEFNELERYSKYEVKFTKSIRTEKDEVKTMFFSLKKPYTLIVKKDELKCYLEGVEIKYRVVLSFFEELEFAYLQNAKIFLRDCLLNETKKVEEDLFDKSILDVQIIKENINNISLKNVSFDKNLAEECATIQRNKLLQLQEKQPFEKESPDSELISCQTEYTVGLKSNFIYKAMKKGVEKKMSFYKLLSYSASKELQDKMIKKSEITITFGMIK